MINQGTHHHHVDCKCFSWKPVIAGALIIIGLSFLLNLFNVAIGLTAFTTNSQGVETLALGGMIATALGLIAAMFGAGWVTGYLGGRYCTKRHIGALYGFLAWCLALIASLYLAESIHTYIVYYTHFISGTPVDTTAASKAASQVAAAVTPSDNLVISTYIVFCLFFLSAFACTIGGHLGMEYIDKDERTA